MRLPDDAPSVIESVLWSFQNGTREATGLADNVNKKCLLRETLPRPGKRTSGQNFPPKHQ